MKHSYHNIYAIYILHQCVKGWKLLYIIGLVEALIFCGLGWLLSGFTVSSLKHVSPMLIFNKILRWVLFQLLYAAMNLTSNEMFNYKRYNYLKNARGKYHNPFSRGVCHNMAEYFACISPAEPEHESIRDL